MVWLRFLEAFKKRVEFKIRDFAATGDEVINRLEFEIDAVLGLRHRILPSMPRLVTECGFSSGKRHALPWRAGGRADSALAADQHASAARRHSCGFLGWVAQGLINCPSAAHSDGCL